MGQDRNDLARQQFQMARARTQFAQALASGQTGLYDRFGALVQPKDLVVYHLPNDMIYEIVDIVPVLDPKAPVGLLKVTMMMTADINFPAGQGVIPLIKCGRQQAPGHSSLETPQGASSENAEAPPEMPPAAVEEHDEEPEALVKIE